MIYRAINGLIRHAIEADLITNDDIFVVRNQLMDILKLTDWNDKEPLTGNIEELLEPLIDYAVKAGIIEDTSVQRDLFDTRVMGVFTPMPREVNAAFQRKYSASPSAATEWYYAFSKSLNYVRAERIAKDLKWTYESEYGTLDITINRSSQRKILVILLLNCKKNQPILHVSFVLKIWDSQVTRHTLQDKIFVR